MPLALAACGAGRRRAWDASSRAVPRIDLADERLALAMVVDSPDRPEEAAALEERPYRLLLGKVRVGPGERTLRPLAKAGIGDEKLARDPEALRGEIVHEFGIVGEIERVDAPGVGRRDRDAVYAGVVGTPQGRVFAFRALRRPADAPLYPGDRVWISGYFLKMIPIDDASGERHRMPLVVSPWPTYTGKWWPAGVAVATAAELGFPLPSREVPHERTIHRLVIDVADEGGIAVDGVAMPRAAALHEIKRSSSAHPGRTMIVRTPTGLDGPAARKLVEEAGVKQVIFKRLVREAPGKGRSGQ